MKDENGVIYILTNPSFPNYVKIGYAGNLEKRLRDLNRSKCVPFVFHPYAVYEIGGRLQYKNIHRIIDRLNPSLKAIDKFSGRVKESFAMSPENTYKLPKDAFSTMDKPKRIQPKKHEIRDENLEQKTKVEVKERQSPTSFEKCQIPVGSELIFTENEEIRTVVLPNNKMKHKGKNIRDIRLEFEKDYINDKWES